MSNIGTFHKASDGGFRGRIHTLALDAQTSIVPASQCAETEPAAPSQLPLLEDKTADFRIFAGRVELGAAWKKPDASGEGLLLKLDDPIFHEPILAELVPTEEANRFALFWSRS